MEFENKAIDLINIAHQYGQMASTCLSRKIGSIITNKDGIILAKGYNYPEHYNSCRERNPNGENICPRQLLGFHRGGCLILCDAVHAEVSCVRNYKMQNRSDKVLYMYMDCGIPCLGCMYEIIGLKIKKLYCTSSGMNAGGFSDDNEYKFKTSFELSQKHDIELNFLDPSVIKM